MKLFELGHLVYQQFLELPYPAYLGGISAAAMDLEHRYADRWDAAARSLIRTTLSVANVAIEEGAVPGTYSAQAAPNAERWIQYVESRPDDFDPGVFNAWCVFRDLSCEMANFDTQYAAVERLGNAITFDERMKRRGGRAINAVDKIDEEAEVVQAIRKIEAVAALAARTFHTGLPCIPQRLWEAIYGESVGGSKGSA